MAGETRAERVAAENIAAMILISMMSGMRGADGESQSIAAGSLAALYIDADATARAALSAVLRGKIGPEMHDWALSMARQMMRAFRLRAEDGN